MAIQPESAVCVQRSIGSRTRLSALRRTLLAIMLAELVSALPAAANPNPNPGGGPQWNQRMQQWERMPPDRRQRILREQQRYQRLSPQEQKRLREQYRERQR
ncbi:MAG: DUF3106 domain-containing protein [Proteobacteria bacterium]|nr:DUF3106 domain-containing protein [Pseudomonadota bacterium]